MEPGPGRRRFRSAEEESTRVWMPWSIECVIERRLLYEPGGVHDGDPIGHL
jgi:hypothetical protein